MNSTLETAVRVGITHAQKGDHLRAMEIFQSILAADPKHIETLFHLSTTLNAVGKRVEAIEIAHQIAPLLPPEPDGIIALGNQLQKCGDLAGAVQCFAQAAQLRPNLPTAHYNLANALLGLGQTQSAINAFQTAIALRPQFCEAYNNLGTAYLAISAHEFAIAAFSQAIALRPNYLDAMNNLGTALESAGRCVEAAEILRRAVNIDPRIPELHNNLGNALRTLGKFDDAIAAYNQALALRPDYLQTYTNLGNTLLENRQPARSIEFLTRAIELNPNYPEPHFGLAMALLSTGQFEQGWREFEWRWGVHGFPTRKREFIQPQWDGSGLQGRTLLIHSEQGFGDTIQFLRFVPLAARLGGTIKLDIAPDLQQLARTLEHAGTGIEILDHDCVPSVDKPTLLDAGPFDVHIPIMSLPLALKLNGIADVSIDSYLQAEPQLVRKCAGRFDAAAGRKKIGLAWRGSPKPFNRSVPAEFLAPLSDSGAAFYALQFALTPEERAALTDLHLVDLTPDISNFAESAAMLANLDLVISNDTAIAHLAGAMGKPTWVMLSYAADWRWNLAEDLCPWYPSMRVFRQKIPGDWGSVIARISEGLRQFMLI